ncbi:Hypothetical protein D9617_7g029430 [Elsinoe fawcettii]|nr:Hypothetical protein D9617_7g029430 [Elsinoe fawcettii]
MQTRNRFDYPGPQADVLFPADVLHGTRGANFVEAGCDMSKARKGESTTDEFPTPAIHRGTVGTAECVLRDAMKRDKLAQDEDIMCFDMEAAGALNAMPCLVIRGITDYCDSHKNDDWHGPAALNAASYARESAPVFA